jgi:DNA-directed RNA polymerase subunit RPC12/RpoP
MDRLDRYQELGTGINDKSLEKCPDCDADLSDYAVVNMTEEQIETLEDGFCPYCGARVI